MRFRFSKLLSILQLHLSLLPRCRDWILNTLSGRTRDTFDLLWVMIYINNLHLKITGEDSKLVRRRKRPKVDTLFTNILASTFGLFRLYRLNYTYLRKSALANLCQKFF